MTTGKALERVPSKEEINNLARIANNLGKSGLFPDARDGYAAFGKILLGRSIGLGPMQAMTGIHVVEGKPQLAATTLAGFVRESETYDYRVLKHTATECLIEFGLGDPPPGKITRLDISEEGGISVDPEWPNTLGVSGFTVDEAKAANLGKWPDEKKWAVSQWGKWPKNMVFARAMSNGVKWYCPDLFGGVPVYTEGDEFETTAELTSGAGDGEPSGVELHPDVEALLERARLVGHSGLADRGAAEMALTGQPHSVVEAWIASANADLDGWQPVADAGAGDVPEDAEVVDPIEDARAKREIALSLVLDAEAAEADGDEDGATRARAEAAELREEALALDPNFKTAEVD